MALHVSLLALAQLTLVNVPQLILEQIAKFLMHALIILA